MPGEERASHWNRAYAEKPIGRLGWYRPRLERSLAWIESLQLPKAAAIVDIGGGASSLVDDLLEAGYCDITVLDVSATALEHAKARLGERAEAVRWLVADVTTAELPADAYALWHDRAVFHFLVDAGERERYRAALARSLGPGGHLLIGTFAPDAPPRCSGLPVERYDRDTLVAEFGDDFVLLDSVEELHVTPGGVEQNYLYCLFRYERLD
jgi:SAM-dependent methyltransferase